MGYVGMFDSGRQMKKEQDLGRAKNVLQDYLIRKLLFPKVYLDAEWNGREVDVLAIDREGTGDVHVAKIEYYRGDSIDTVLQKTIEGTDTFGEDHDSVTVLRSLPGHFLYIAVVHGTPGTCKFKPSGLNNPELLAKDGVGRIGILYVDLGEDDPTVRVILRAERFRSSKEIVELADRYVAEHTANWELRE
jgi:hypothetical protein